MGGAEQFISFVRKNVGDKNTDKFLEEFSVDNYTGSDRDDVFFIRSKGYPSLFLIANGYEYESEYGIRLTLKGNTIACLYML